jgi:hypothetical protein
VLNEFVIDGVGDIHSSLRELMDKCKHSPNLVKNILFLAVKKHKFSMQPLVLAALYGKTDEQWLTANVKDLASIIHHLQPDELMWFVELMKDRVFVRGLGSRPQRVVKATMEDWSESDLFIFTSESPSSMKRLLNLIHPKYQDGRSKIIAKFLNK